MPQLTQAFIQKVIQGRKDPSGWIQQYVSVVHSARGIIPFKLYDFQKRAITLMLAKHFVITLKSRQVGASTIMQAFCLWAALLYQNYKILILSTGMRTAIRFLTDLRGMYDRLPEEWKWKITDEDVARGQKKIRTTNNKTEISFANGSVITALPANSPAARGASINLLVIDEAGFIKNIEETFMGIFPTLSRAFKSQGGKPYGVIVISTPNGIDGDGRWYYNMYTAAVEKKSRFTPMRIHWTEVDEYDEKWYIEQCETVGWDYRLIQSELELSFLSSGNTYLPGKLLSMIEVRKPLRTTMDNALWIFKEPIPDHKYVMGVDFAYGTGKDASAIQVVDASNLEQVAEYLSTTVQTSTFAQVIANVSTMYNNALVNIERNAGGKILIERVLEDAPEMESRLFRDSKSGDVLGAQNKFGQIIRNSNDEIGTQVTGVSRDVILSNMYNIVIEQYLMLAPDLNMEKDGKEAAKARFLSAKNEGGRKKEVKVHGIINSERLLLQLLGFVTDKLGKPQGEKDDAVLAYAHTLYLWAKARHYILKDVTNLIPEKPKEIPQLELEKVYTTANLRSFNPGMTQKQIDDYIEMLDEEDDKGFMASGSDRFNSVWGAFLSPDAKYTNRKSNIITHQLFR